MKIAILGGGITGLTAGYCLAKKHHRVTVFEKENILGGMASGFKTKDWDWLLDNTYHHIFANDQDFLNFAQELSFNKFLFKEPETASFYQVQPKKYAIYPLDTPYNLLRFPLINFFQKIRTGLIIAFLKISPPLLYYESQTARDFLKKTMGNQVWKTLWQELFRKKFGKYAGNILASFFWARIKKRTKRLGYIKGGFQNLVDCLEKENNKFGCLIKKGQTVTKINKNNENQLVVYYSSDEKKIIAESFDIVISTLPTPILIKAGENLLPKDYFYRLKKIKYLHALTLVIETDQPYFDKAYWLNIADTNTSIMGIVQHTNFIDKKYYGGKHILYCGWYAEEKDKIWQMNDREILKLVVAYLGKITNREPVIANHFVLRSLYAQPIFNREFLNNKPNFITPIKNFYIANLDMTYPYDRGVNYAVVLGKKISKMI